MNQRVKAIVRRLVDVPGLAALGHYAPIPVFVLVALSRVLASFYGYRPAYLVIVSIVPLGLAMFVHHCSICMRGSCKTFIGSGSAEAARHRSTLRRLHRPWKDVTLWCLLVLWLVTTVSGEPLFTIVPTVAIGVLEWRAVVWHNRIRPWCPYCRSGGDPHKTPSPVFSGGLGRNNP